MQPQRAAQSQGHRMEYRCAVYAKGKSERASVPSVGSPRLGEMKPIRWTARLAAVPSVINGRNINVLKRGTQRGWTGPIFLSRQWCQAGRLTDTQKGRETGGERVNSVYAPTHGRDRGRKKINGKGL